MTHNDTFDTRSGGNTVTPSRKRRWCFTWNNYTNEDFDTLTHELSNISKGFIVGKETGESGTPHLQGYIEFENAIAFTSLKNKWPKMHLEAAKGNRLVNLKYCSKQGDYISNLEVPLTKRERVLKNKYNDVKWLDWQQKIIDIINGPKNDRIINWVIDTKGNKGKSFLSKYLYCKHGIIIANGKKDDIFNEAKTYAEENNEDDPEVIICDTPRCMSTYISYAALEKLKDGLFYSGKYQGGVILYEESPHVIVFANIEPDYEMFSEDRWNIIRL